MWRMSGVPEEVDAFLRERHPDVRDLALWVREHVLASDPYLTERVYRGWDGIGFRHPEGYVCAIYPRDDEAAVRLLFEHGVKLEDPHGLLAGEGTQTRFIPITSSDPELADRIGDYVREAIAERLFR